MMFRSFAVLCIAASMAVLSNAQCDASTSLTVEDYDNDLVPAAAAACSNTDNDCAIDFGEFNSTTAFACTGTIVYETLEQSCDGRKVTANSVPFCQQAGSCDGDTLEQYIQTIGLADINTAYGTAGVGSAATGPCMALPAESDGSTTVAPVTPAPGSTTSAPSGAASFTMMIPAFVMLGGYFFL